MKLERVWPQALLCALAVAIGYAGSLQGPFLLDDRRPYPLRERPLTVASFHLNEALSGDATWSWHAFNLLAHLACGLVLLAVLRRLVALVAPGLPRGTGQGLALATTLLWLVHPLQTAAVSYVSQRAEVLASLFYLGTFLCFLRYRSDGHPLRWSCLAGLCLALGYASKEIIATAPAAILLADACLPDGRPLDNLRRHARFHLALFLLSGLFFRLIILPPLLENPTSGFGLRESFGPLEYLRSQPGVVLHYLRLVFWPHPLVFDYGWPVATAARDWVPQAALLGAALLLGLGLLARRSWVGYALACFFLILAPTSSVMPIKDLAFEHRMYLPLAAVIALAVAGASWLRARWLPRARRLPVTLAVALALLLLGLTVRRNLDYRSAVDLWRTVVERAPSNPRGHTNLGAALVEAGREAQGQAELETALRLDPDSSYAHQNLGVLAARSGDIERALGHLRRAVELNGSADNHANLGRVLARTGDDQAAEPHLRRALELEPGDEDARTSLAGVLLRLGHTAEARALLRRPGE